MFQHFPSRCKCCFSLSFSHFFPLFFPDRDSEEFSDPEYITSPSLSKLFPCPAADTSSPNLFDDDTELLLDRSIAKPLRKDVEAVRESPVRKISVQELEASVDASCRKMAKDKVLDASFESASLKAAKEGSLLENSSRKISRDRCDIPLNVAVRKGISDELDEDSLVTKVERDAVGDFVDIATRNVYREKSDLPRDVRKMFRNELEALTDAAPRKLCTDVMGISVDSGSRKYKRDEADRPFETLPRRPKRDSVGKSLDASYRKISRSKGECPPDAPVRAMTVDKMSEAAKILRKISRDELEYHADSASMRSLPRDNPLASYSEDREEVGSEATVNKKKLEEELQTSLGSLRRGAPRLVRDDSNSSMESHVEKMPSDKDNLSAEGPKRSLVKQDSGASDHSGQHDLMVTSQGLGKCSSELYIVGVPSQMVYDGILEKSYSPVATAAAGLSASTASLAQCRLQAEEEPPLPPPRVILQSLSDGPKDKEKSKKSLKLKNLFKKKNEVNPEKLQSGLQKL